MMFNVSQLWFIIEAFVAKHQTDQNWAEFCLVWSKMKFRGLLNLYTSAYTTVKWKNTFLRTSVQILLVRWVHLYDLGYRCHWKALRTINTSCNHDNSPNKCEKWGRHDSLVPGNDFVSEQLWQLQLLQSRPAGGGSQSCQLYVLSNLSSCTETGLLIKTFHKLTMWTNQLQHWIQEQVRGVTLLTLLLCNL